VDKEKLTAGTRVVLDMTTLTIMRILPREVQPSVLNLIVDHLLFDCLPFFIIDTFVSYKSFDRLTQLSIICFMKTREMLVTLQLEGFQIRFEN
jgi:hypothetical protein